MGREVRVSRTVPDLTEQENQERQEKWGISVGKLRKKALMERTSLDEMGI